MLKIHQQTLRHLFFLLTALFISSCAVKNSSYESAKQNYAHGDYARAFQQLWIPARQKDPRALYAMGYMYYYGIGTDKDQDLGRSLIRRAADMKYRPAIIGMRLITQARQNQYVPFEQYQTRTVKSHAAKKEKHFAMTERKGVKL